MIINGLKASNMLLSGIDDAGRGAVIGPLIIAGIIINENDIHKIIKLNVKDSKLILPKTRSRLAIEIFKNVSDYYVVTIPPREIDKFVETGKKFYRLNRLEAQAMAKVIKNLKPDVAYVDASDVFPYRFAQHILEEIPFKIDIISEHNADKTYPIVSAASIIAKVERDKAIEKLNLEYGRFGSGYASDSRTIIFLENWFKKYNCFPDFVRRSWKTVKKIKSNVLFKKKD